MQPSEKLWVDLLFRSITQSVRLAASRYHGDSDHDALVDDGTATST